MKILTPYLDCISFHWCPVCAQVFEELCYLHHSHVTCIIATISRSHHCLHCDQNFRMTVLVLKFAWQFIKFWLSPCFVPRTPALSFPHVATSICSLYTLSKGRLASHPAEHPNSCLRQSADFTPYDATNATYLWWFSILYRREWI